MTLAHAQKYLLMIRMELLLQLIFVGQSINVMGDPGKWAVWIIIVWMYRTPQLVRFELVRCPIYVSWFVNYFLI